jgi:hypothetical protein
VPKTKTPALVKPAYLWVPDHTSSAGAEAADLAESAGLVLDLEQRLALDTILAENGSYWAALEAAIIEARQNGKTVVLLAIVLAGLFLFGEELIIWSAHLFSTTQEAFRDLCALIEGAAHLSRRVKRISAANGEEGVELIGGQRCLFKARTKAGGRGLGGDRVLLDEAGFLGPTEMGALFPTLSARENPQVVYAASAGVVGSHILRGIRDRGRKGGDPTLAYLEYCARKGECANEGCDHRPGAKGCVLDDEKRWHEANPTLGRRITIAYVRAERRALPPEEFARERLSWWDEPAGDGEGIPLEKWAACSKPKAKLVDPVTLAVDVSPNSTWASIAACGGPIEIIEHRRGASWVVARLTELSVHQPTSIGLDPSGPAGALIPDLETAGLEIRTDKNPDGLLVLLSGREMVQACGAIYAATVEGDLVHLDDADLNDAVAGACRRQSGDAWRWSRRDSTVDISPLVAATVARFLWSQAGQSKESDFFTI